MIFRAGIFYFLIFTTILSCSDPSDNVETINYLSVDVPLNDVFFDEVGWVAAGGDIYESGIIYSSTWDQTEYQTDSIYQHSVLSYHSEDQTFATGIYSIHYKFDWGWKSLRTPELYNMHDAIIKGGKIVAVGGAGLGVGVVYEVDTLLQTDQKKEIPFLQELNCIEQVGDSYFIGGYGTLMKTDDFENFERLDPFDDYFIDMVYSEDLGLLVLGASGRLIQTKDEGATWTQLNGPKFSGISSYTDLLLVNDKLYLTGEGVIEFTSVNDIQWEKYNLSEIGQINRLGYWNGILFLATNDGLLLGIMD